MKRLTAILLIIIAMLFVGACTKQADKKAVSNTISSTTDTANKKSDLITKDQAKENALKHAGFDKAEVKFLKAEYDYEKGCETYEVEFRKDNFEYDYTIDAISGEILHFEKDFDD